jgi:PhoPQ-activated pathogenicity-related protein
MRNSPLNAYVRKPDPSFGWRLHHWIEGANHRAAVLELTSQTWLTAAQVDRPVWKHWLTLVIPPEIKHDTAFLHITGGQHGDPAPEKAIGRFIKMAVETGTVVAELQNVPNQPLTFAERPGEPLIEDAIIAHRQVGFLESRDPEALVRLPMVKSGVAAMTAIQQFTASEAGGGTEVARFVVSGGSKRGWTTWLAGAVDRRVRAIIPIVINVLNQDQVIRHHWGAMGFFSPALKDYVEHGLVPGKIGDPGLVEVRRIEDPMGYMGRRAMRMPKLIINAVGDEFFPPDATRYSFRKLPPVKRLRVLPNSRHSTEGTDIFDTMLAFYDAVLNDRPLPDYHWRVGKDGAVVVRPSEPPREALLWRATNPERRDFRVDTLGERAFEATPLIPRNDGTVVARVAAPERGFTAWFVELTFEGATRYPFKFTTEVFVTPDVLPHRWEDARPIMAPLAAGS